MGMRPDVTLGYGVALAGQVGDDDLFINGDPYEGIIGHPGIMLVHNEACECQWMIISETHQGGYGYGEESFDPTVFNVDTSGFDQRLKDAAAACKIDFNESSQPGWKIIMDVG